MRKAFFLAVLFFSPFFCGVRGASSLVEPPPPPAALIKAEPASLDFGNVNIDTFSAQALTISNQGSLVLSLGSIAVSEPFWALQDNCSDKSLSAYSSCAVELKFQPTGLGMYNAVLSLPYTDPVGNPYTLTVPMSGTGTPGLVADISTDRQYIDFGIVIMGGTISTDLTVRNDGSASLTIQSLSITGTNASQFSYSGSCASIAPSGSCTLAVKFTPSSAGLKSATLRILSSDPDEGVLDIALSGAGVEPSATPDAGGGSANSGGGSSTKKSDSRCLIATAAYGSPLEPHVQALRRFRDERLLTNAAGRALVELYYRHSPPAAEFVARHEGIRAFTRLLLAPIVLGVKYPLLLLAFLMAGVAIFVLRKPFSFKHKPL